MRWQCVATYHSQMMWASWTQGWINLISIQGIIINLDLKLSINVIYCLAICELCQEHTCNKPYATTCKIQNSWVIPHVWEIWFLSEVNLKILIKIILISQGETVKLCQWGMHSLLKLKVKRKYIVLSQYVWHDFLARESRWWRNT